MSHQAILKLAQTHPEFRKALVAELKQAKVTIPPRMLVGNAINKAIEQGVQNGTGLSVAKRQKVMDKALAEPLQRLQGVRHGLMWKAWTHDIWGRYPQTEFQDQLPSGYIIENFKHRPTGFWPEKLDFTVTTPGGNDAGTYGFRILTSKWFWNFNGKELHGKISPNMDPTAFGISMAKLFGNYFTGRILPTLSDG